MKRNDEYQILLAELEGSPPALEHSLTRAEARMRKRRLGRILGVPVGSVAVFLATFTLLVNLMPTFAVAVSRIPLLAELAAAVAWSPTLSTAVEHDYVQPIAQEQTKNGITARIEHVIVDQKQVHVFYTLNSDNYPRLEVGRETVHDLEGFGLSRGSFGLENGTLSSFSLNFTKGKVPDTLTITLPVHQWEERSDFTAPEASASARDEDQFFNEVPLPEPESLAEFTFTLTFDPYFTDQGETLVLNQAFQLDGQTLTLSTVEIFPTTLRLTFLDDPENTAWLEDMEFYLENERGERFEGISNGISSTGGMQINGEITYYLESSFFSGSEVLNLHIQRAQWLDKDKTRIRVDLEQGTADWLPEHVERFEVKRFAKGWTLSFTARMSGARQVMYSVVQGITYEDGEPVDRLGCISSTSKTLEREGWFEEQIPIQDYDGTVLYLIPSFNRVAEFPQPVTLSIK